MRWVSIAATGASEAPRLQALTGIEQRLRGDVPRRASGRWTSSRPAPAGDLEVPALVRPALAPAQRDAGRHQGQGGGVEVDRAQVVGP